MARNEIGAIFNICIFTQWFHARKWKKKKKLESLRINDERGTDFVVVVVVILFSLPRVFVPSNQIFKLLNISYVVYTISQIVICVCCFNFVDSNVCILFVFDPIPTLSLSHSLPPSELFNLIRNWKGNEGKSKVTMHNFDCTINLCLVRLS